MTITAHLRIEHDGEVMVEDRVEYDEFEGSLWSTLSKWLVNQGRLARDLYYGPPPKPMPKLPREEWDKELMEKK